MNKAPQLGLTRGWSCELLQDWFSGSHGRALLNAELRLLGEWLPTLPGRQIVQFGIPVAVDLLAASRCRSKLSLQSSAWQEPDESLPLSEATTDVLLLPHSLEFAAHPRVLLAAARRALVDGGHLLLFFFNARPPQSLDTLLGAHRPDDRCGGISGRRLAAQARVRRLLAEQDLKIKIQRNLYYLSWPGTPREVWWTAPTMSWSRFLPGAVCVLLCEKRGIPLIPLRRRWAARRPELRGIREPLRIEPGVTRAPEPGAVVPAAHYRCGM